MGNFDALLIVADACNQCRMIQHAIDLETVSDQAVVDHARCRAREKATIIIERHQRWQIAMRD
jgi:hypothetical protein